jgi:hypothetical protein
VKVYIEDPIMGDTTIGGARCRRLGDLKNGETKTFSIDENQTRIFVIADAMSKNYCNEFCTVPEGSNDVFLTGQNRYNPTNGNAFQFDGQADEAVLANRRKNTKRGLIILIAAVIAGFVLGIVIGLLEHPEPKTFRVLDGLEITLTDEFEIDTEEYDLVVLTTYDNIVGIYRYGFDEALLPSFSEMTDKEYGEYVAEMFELTDVEMQSRDGVWYFEYVEAIDGDDLYSLHTVFKGEDAFWSVEFTCFADEKDEWIDQYWEWTDSVQLPAA